MTDETGMVLMPRGNVQEMLDIIVGSLDYGSGFLDREQIEILRAVAEMLGLDPMTATPSNYAKSYPHAFQAWVSSVNGPMLTCAHCSALVDAPWHVSPPETVVPAT